MPLQFDIDVLTAKKIAKLPDGLRRFRDSAVRKRMRQRSFFAAAKANQAGRAIRDVFRENAAFALFRMQFHARNQAAKILISPAAFHEQCVMPPGRRGDLRPDVSFERELVCGEMESRSAIYAVAVEEGHSLHSLFRTDAGQFFRDGGAFEKTESGARMKFGVHQSYIPATNQAWRRTS